MDDLIMIIAPSWFKNAGATEEQINKASSSLGIKFPADYIGFLSWSDGGEGQIGNKYFSFWGSDEIKQLNEDYQISKYLPSVSVIGIGTDGGGQCYALDYRENPEAPSFIQCPLGDLDDSSIVILGSSFRNGIERALSSK